jgi:KipI family sensor histidine kinase inhibitor
MTVPDPVRLFGDGAVVVDVAGVDQAHTLHALLTGRMDRSPHWTGVEEIVVGFDTVTVIADPVTVDLDALQDDLRTAAAAASDAGAHHPPAATTRSRRRLEIPVVFDGPDLATVARASGQSERGVVELLTGAELAVAFIGFAPGFAYLHGLPPPLAAVGRRATPRPSVPAGSVALAGGFAAVYPQATPGGWHLVGRTDVSLFHPDHPPFAVLGPGVRVRFVVVAELSGPDAGSAAGGAGSEGRPRLRADTARRVAVEAPGPLSLVEDGGRIGVAALGVPRAGAADPDALRIANRLVGNSEGSAALEVTLSGPTLRFEDDAHVAVVGDAPVAVDGRAVPADTVVPVSAGQRLAVGALRRGARATLAVGGAIEVPVLLGSRSSDVLCGLGPGPLRAGDELGLGEPTRPHGDVGPPLDGAWSGDDDVLVLRVLAGPDDTGGVGLEHLLGTTWRVAPDSNRVGVRLVDDDTTIERSGASVGPADAADPVAAGAERGVTSRAMVTGAVQLPADGRPIVLGCDHATVGGFPVVATVASVDLGRVGRCRPGDRVRLVVVALDEARRQRARLERAIAAVGTGWYPSRSG